jgi:hypothetical protein
MAKLALFITNTKAQAADGQAAYQPIAGTNTAAPL